MAKKARSIRAAKDAFTGFPTDCRRFLAELADNNNRDWFQANQERYEASVREPALLFIAAMQPRLARIAPHFEAVPKKAGGSLMRVHRDTRFSKNKSPYKVNVGIQFCHEVGKDVHAPGYYFHIEPKLATGGDPAALSSIGYHGSGCMLAVGLWRPEPAALRAIRERIDADPKAWLKARDQARFRANWELSGDSLRRAPKGFSPDHPLIDDLKRTDFVAIQSIPVGRLSKPELVDEVTDSLKTAKPFIQYLCEAVDVPF